MKRSICCLVTSVLIGILSPGLSSAADYKVDRNDPAALRSISDGLHQLQPGDTLWIGPGVYRETLHLPQSGRPGAPITLRALPGARVEIKGSDPVTGWIPHSGNIWKKTGWEVNSQQVFVDGAPLQQIGRTSPLHSEHYDGSPILPAVGNGLADMRPKSFYYDSSAKTLYVWLEDGSSPGNHQVEASVRDYLLPPRQYEYIQLEGLNFAHSNLTSKGLITGMVNVWGRGWNVSRCSFNHSDFAGVSVAGDQHRILNSQFNHNGNVGISVTGSDQEHNWEPVLNRAAQGIIFEGNETSGNNYRNFFLPWQSGGLKAVSCAGIQIIAHRAIANNGVGVWFDGFCRDVMVRSSVTSFNSVGIAFEISDQARIINNLVTGNQYQGIYISASSEAIVAHNTVDENGFGIAVHGMPRADHPRLDDNQVFNNIIANSRLADLVMYWNPNDTRSNFSDYNLYHSSTGREPTLVWTSDASYDFQYRGIEALSLATGQERNSFVGDPLWIDREGGNYSLREGSPALNAGTTALGGLYPRPVSGLSVNGASAGKQVKQSSAHLGAFGLAAP